MTLGVYSSVRSGSTSTSLLQSWLVFFWGSWESLLLTSFFTSMLSWVLKPHLTDFMHFSGSKRRWKHPDYVCAHVPSFIKDHLVSLTSFRPHLFTFSRRSFLLSPALHRHLFCYITSTACHGRAFTSLPLSISPPPPDFEQGKKKDAWGGNRNCGLWILTALFNQSECRES